MAVIGVLVIVFIWPLLFIENYLVNKRKKEMDEELEKDIKEMHEKYEKFKKELEITRKYNWY